MKQRMAGGARHAAVFLLGMAHMALGLWAGSAAGGWAWRHGYTLPYDTSSSAGMSAAIVFGLLAAGAVLVLPEPWMNRVRHLIAGRPLVPCPTCGAPTPPPASPDTNTTPKEIAQ
ncbi:hypothetical protein [Streptomyces goshikiensis]|uniref:hypothetical protein n=1 Tax=Streptomyces goshikiensis TaxID=1942 RepID=UPI0037BC8342